MNFARKRAAISCLAAVLSFAALAQAKKPPKTDAPTTPPPAGDVIQLPGAADLVRTGASGRLLVLRVKSSGALCVVDIVARKLLKQIPATPDSPYAATNAKLIVAQNGEHKLQRYDLKTLEADLSVSLPAGANVAKMSSGANGAGPLAIVLDNGLALYSVDTLKPLVVAGTLPTADQHSHISVSADGLHFVIWRGGRESSLVSLRKVTAASCEVVSAATGADTSFNESWAMPNPDGSLLVAMAKGPTLIDHAGKNNVPSRWKDEVLFPTQDPRFLVSVRGEKKGKVSNFEILSAFDQTTLYSVKGIDPFTEGTIKTSQGRLGHEPRVRFLPEEKLVATICNGNDHVIVYPVDLLKLMVASGKSDLVFISNPKTEAGPGEAVIYVPEAISPAGSVKYKLDKAPSGMTLSTDGKISWKASAAGSKATVAVSATDASGKSATQSFEIVVTAPAPVVIAARTPEPTAVATAPRSSPSRSRPAPRSVAMSPRPSAAPQTPQSRPTAAAQGPATLSKPIKRLPAPPEVVELGKKLAKQLDKTEQDEMQQDPGRIITVSASVTFDEAFALEDGPMQIFFNTVRVKMPRTGGATTEHFYMNMALVKKEGAKWRLLVAQSIRQPGPNEGHPKSGFLNDDTPIVRRALGIVQGDLKDLPLQLKPTEPEDMPIAGGNVDDADKQFIRDVCSRFASIEKSKVPDPFTIGATANVGDILPTKAGVHSHMLVMIDKRNEDNNGFTSIKYDVDFNLKKISNDEWICTRAALRLADISGREGGETFGTGPVRDVTADLDRAILSFKKK